MLHSLFFVHCEHVVIFQCNDISIRDIIAIFAVFLYLYHNTPEPVFQIIPLITGLRNTGDEGCVDSDLF